MSSLVSSAPELGDLAAREFVALLMQVNLCPGKPPHVPVEEIHVRGDGVDAAVTEEQLRVGSCVSVPPQMVKCVRWASPTFTGPEFGRLRSDQNGLKNYFFNNKLIFVEVGPMTHAQALSQPWSWPWP